MFGANETSSIDLQTRDTVGRRSQVKLGVAILCAVTVTALLTIGYVFLVRRHAEQLRAEAARQEALLPKPGPSPQVQLFIDDAMIKGSVAVLGGTILNVSTDTLTGLTVELELKRRRDGGSEIRVLSLEPGDLEPQQQGRYSVHVPSRDFRETHVKRIRSSRSSVDVPFKTLPGAQRPAERLPTRETITIKPTPKRGKGEEFINTPDNPVTVP